MNDKKETDERGKSRADNEARDRAADVRAAIAKRRAEHSKGKHLKK